MLLITKFSKLSSVISDMLFSSAVWLARFITLIPPFDDGSVLLFSMALIDGKHSGVVDVDISSVKQSYKVVFNSVLPMLLYLSAKNACR